MATAIATVEAGPLAQLTQARELLEASRDLGEVKHIRDVAIAAEQYARARQLGAEAERYAAEISIRAERRIGQLLAGIPKEQGRRDYVEDGPEPEPSSTPRQQAGKKLSARSQRLAKIPEGEFEEKISSGKRLSAARMAADVKRDETLERIASNGDPAALDRIPPCPVLLADPPWQYEGTPGGSAQRRLENNYPTMTLADIKALEIPAADDAALFLWATSPKLTEALEVMAAWGFTYRTCMVWVKDRPGMGSWARQRHELLLIGKRGNIPAPPEAARPDSVIEAPRGDHSAKPPIVHDLIEAMYPGLPRVELFARQAHPGWHTWGNEAES